MIDLCKLIWCAFAGLFRSWPELEAEILVLRHQLNVLRRKAPGRLVFSSMDQLVFAGEMLGYIVKHMATKEDIAALATQVTSIERELKSIRCDLNDLLEKVGNVSDFRKEIDDPLERIAAIENHLGLDKKIAA